MTQKKNSKVFDTHHWQRIGLRFTQLINFKGGERSRSRSFCVVASCVFPDWWVVQLGAAAGTHLGEHNPGSRTLISTPIPLMGEAWASWDRRRLRRETPPTSRFGASYSWDDGTRTRLGECAGRFYSLLSMNVYDGPDAKRWNPVLSFDSTAAHIRRLGRDIEWVMLRASITMTTTTITIATTSPQIKRQRRRRLASSGVPIIPGLCPCKGTVGNSGEPWTDQICL